MAILKSEIVGKSLLDLSDLANGMPGSSKSNPVWRSLPTKHLAFIDKCTLRYPNSYGAKYKIDLNHELTVKHTTNGKSYTLESYKKLLDMIVTDYDNDTQSSQEQPMYLDRKPVVGDYVECIRSYGVIMYEGSVWKVIRISDDGLTLDNLIGYWTISNFKVINPEYQYHPEYKEQPMPTSQDIKVVSHWERINFYSLDGEIVTVEEITGNFVHFNKNRTLSIEEFLERFKPRPDLDTAERKTPLCTVTFTDKVETTRTKFKYDHYTLAVNPDFFNPLPTVDRLALIKHELLHILVSYNVPKKSWTQEQLEKIQKFCNKTIDEWLTQWDTQQPSTHLENFTILWHEDIFNITTNTPDLDTATSEHTTDNAYKFDLGDLIYYTQEARDTLISATGTLPNEIVGTVTKVLDRAKLGSSPLLEYEDIHGEIQGIDSGWVTKYVATPTKKHTVKPKPVAQQEPIQLTTKETFMSKIKDTALTTVGQNKQALVIASKMEAGRIINKQVLKQLKPHLPFFLQGYASSPFAPFIAANLVAMIANHTQNSKLLKVSDLMLLGAADSGVASFNLNDIVEDILSKIKLPAGALDDSDE